MIKRVHRPVTEPDPLRGLFAATVNGRPAVVEYEADRDLRDTEQIPLMEQGGIEAFLRREVLPYAPDAWFVPSSVKVGYEISFTRHFYKPTPLRSLEADSGGHPGAGARDGGAVGGDPVRPRWPETFGLMSANV